MRLEVDGHILSTNPDDAAVRRALQTQQEFVILATNEMSYMQAGGDADAGFILEYQEDDVEHHYESGDNNISLQKVTDALLSYLRSDDRWRTDLPWQRITI